MSDSRRSLVLGPASLQARGAASFHARAKLLWPSALPSSPISSPDLAQAKISALRARGSSACWRSHNFILVSATAVGVGLASSAERASAAWTNCSHSGGTSLHPCWTRPFHSISTSLNTAEARTLGDKVATISLRISRRMPSGPLPRTKHSPPCRTPLTICSAIDEGMSQWHASSLGAMNSATNFGWNISLPLAPAWWSRRKAGCGSQSLSGATLSAAV